MLFDVHGNLNMELLGDVLETYYESTGIPIKYIDNSGKTLLSCGDEQTFCGYFHGIVSDTSRCEQTHLYTSRQAYNIGESYIFFCPAGLTEFSYPVIHEGIFSGAFIGGPLLMEYPDEIMVDEIMYKNKIDIGHKGKLQSYLRRVSVVEPKRVRYLGKLIEIVGKQLMNEGHQQLKDHRSKMNQQARIGEVIQSMKSQGTLNSIYPYEKEKDLLNKVKKGDVTGAKAILNELLGYVFYSTGDSIEISKARALEICSLLSRAAVEGGGELSKIFGLNFQFIHELNFINNIDELSYWILKVLNSFTENIILLQDSKNPVKIKEAVQFIQSRYTEDITLEQVSSTIGLSPKYLSALFKKEMGESFTEYVNHLRVEEAKGLLTVSDRTILDIALTVGFEDQSYFSKIFKKITGLTPNVYRRLNK